MFITEKKTKHLNVGYINIYNLYMTRSVQENIYFQCFNTNLYKMLYTKMLEFIIYKIIYNCPPFFP